MRAWKKQVYGGHGTKPGESNWATDNAAELVRRFVSRLAAYFRKEGIVVTPWIALRVDEVLLAYALAVEVEERLHANGIFIEDPTEDSTKKESTSRGDESGQNDSKTKERMKTLRLNPAVDLSTKARERLRKALHDLQAACENAQGRTTSSWAEEIAEGLAELPSLESTAFVEFLSTDDSQREAQLLNQLTAGLNE